MDNWIEIKNKLFNECNKMVAEKINAIKNVLTEAQEAANNETKSSAGDKHETGRAMAQLETEKLTTQLAEALKLQQVLDQINPELVHQQVALGSLVITNNGNFYLSVSLGKVEIDHQTYYAISTLSPIAKLLIGLKEEENFPFNGKTYTLKKIT